ncbi:hypothetical protein BD31_I1302 [Candidatus Nitrosopumilus salaria BD31]|uniref:Uncharacterized protein n=1 Tax=Candidatus Nitrosopumilus salarius BD31 TaxID=859350 RepID=I3D2V6_9ARCH|nr:hypothetical protein [Candidatus Nitrosopumilus salaria]EIJ66049.1 hypothetical protein BD31_I1302 [Candidatus Nitrosopumilus salaria BD31]
MVTYECDIFIDLVKQEKNLRERIKKRKYKLKGDILEQMHSNGPKSYTFYVKTPPGEFHRNQLIDIFQKLGSTKVHRQWVTEITESAIDKIKDFLQEFGGIALSIYGGSIAVLFGTITHVNAYFPINGEHEVYHLLTKIEFSDWIILFALAGIPSFAYLGHQQSEYRKRHSRK